MESHASEYKRASCCLLPVACCLLRCTAFLVPYERNHNTLSSQKKPFPLQEFNQLIPHPFIRFRYMHDATTRIHAPCLYIYINTHIPPSLSKTKHLRLHIMAKNIDFLVCFSIMVLDIIAGILGIQAEVAQNKVQNLRVWVFECRDPSYEAFKLGLAAVVMLCLAHVVANLVAGCIIIGSKEELERASTNKQLAVASLIMSWIMLGIAFILLISGTLANSRSRKNCGISHQRQLSIGGILCFIHGLFVVAYYISADAVLHEDRKPHQHHGQETKPDQPLPA